MTQLIPRHPTWHTAPTANECQVLDPDADLSEEQLSGVTGGCSQGVASSGMCG